MRKPYKDESLRWFTQAKDEFTDADDLRKRKRFYLSLFHFQQASEKALKSYLYLKIKSVDVFYTHSIEELSQMAVDLDADFQKIRPAKKLDQYYISTRYPNGLPGGVPSRYYDDPKEAEDAMILAKQLIDLVAEKLHEC